MTNVLIEHLASPSGFTTLRPLGAAHHRAGLLCQPVRLVVATGFIQFSDSPLYSSQSLFYFAVGSANRLITPFPGATLQTLRWVGDRGDSRRLRCRAFSIVFRTLVAPKASQVLVVLLS